MAVSAFKSEDFEKACENLVGEPDIDDPWEFFTESQNINIYRLYNKDSGLYRYQVFGTLDDVPPDVCAQVYMDIDYRRQWDNYVKELKTVEEEGKTGIYWQINFPFFMSNRDYVFCRELRELDYGEHHVWVCLARSEVFKTVPERPGVIRVTDYVQSAALCSDGKGGSKAYMYYYDNPGGSIPTMVINWAAKTGVPGFLTNMQKACHGYKDYLAS